MSKKKNTLRDLDDFLKQQASLLVVPELNAMQAAAEPLPPEISSGNQVTAVPAPALSDGNFEVREKLYDFIIHSLEKQQDSLPEDAVLINTALYLKNGENWKEAIRQYWKNK